MSNSLNDGNVCTYDVLEKVLSVTGYAKTDNLCRADPFPYLSEEVLGILNGIAPAEGVGRKEDLFAGRQNHGLGRGGTEIASNNNLLSRPFKLSSCFVSKDLRFILLSEGLKLFLCLPQTLSTLLFLLLVLALGNPPAEPINTGVNAFTSWLRESGEGTSEGSVVKSIVGNYYQVFWIPSLWKRNVPLFPDPLKVKAPRFLKTSEEKVRSAKQENLRLRGVSLCQNRKVLINNSLKEARYYLFLGNSRLLEGINIRLCKDPAFGTDLVKLVSEVTHFCQLIGLYAEFSGGLLDEGSGTTSTGTLHEYLTGLFVSFAAEEDGFHIFTADLGDKADLRMKLLNRSCYRNDLLNKAGTDELRYQASSRPGDVDPVPSCFQSLFFLKPLKELKDLFRLPCVVPLIILVKDVSILIYQNVLTGC